MEGGDVGRSARLKRPGMAWKTLIHSVGEPGVESCICSSMVGNTWPVADGLGRACESTRRGLLGTGAVRRLSTVYSQLRRAVDNVMITYAASAMLLPATTRADHVEKDSETCPVEVRLLQLDLQVPSLRTLCCRGP